MCISLLFYSVRKNAVRVGQNAHLPIWYFYCGHKRFFQCPLSHCHVPVFKMCILLLFYRVRKSAVRVLQNAHLPIWYFYCGHRRRFHCLMIHFKVPVFKCCSDCGNKPVCGARCELGKSLTFANRVISAVSGGIFAAACAIFLEMRLWLRCRGSCL